MRILAALVAAAAVVGVFLALEGRSRERTTAAPRDAGDAPAPVDAADAPDELSGLVETLKYGTPKEKLRALRALRDVAPDAAPAVPELLRIVSARPPEHESLPGLAMRVLEAMGPAAKDAVPTLVRWLKGDDEILAGNAGWILSYLGKAALPAMPAMLEILADEELRWERGERLIAVVENLGPAAIDAAPFMLAFIHEMGEAKQEASNKAMLVSWAHTDYRAADALAAIGAGAVPMLIEALGDPVGEAHYSYKLALRDMGDVAVPGLLEALRHEDPKVRENAAEALGMMKKVRSDAMRMALEQALLDPERGVRAAAAGALTKQGEAALPALMRALRDEYWVVQRNAARGVRRHAAKATGAIPDLIPLLKSRFDDVREDAAKALGAMGPRAADAVPALVAALADENEYAREDIADSLGRIGSPAVPAILDALATGDRTVRTAAARALGKVKELDATAARMLTDLLEHEDPMLRLEVAIALKGREVALPALVRGLGHDDHRQRTRAIEAVAGYGKRAKGALPALIEAVRRMEAEYEKEGHFPTFMDWSLKAAGKAIEEIGRHDVPLLVATLSDGSEWARNDATAALAAVGDAALPHLEKAWESADEALRLQVVAVLARMKQDTSLLDAALRDEAPAVRVAAAAALWSKRRDAKRVVPVLVEALDAEGEIPREAAFWLTKIGKHAAFAEADLRKHENSRKDMVAYYVRQVLAAIEAE